MNKPPFDTDSLRRFIELSEGPAGRVRREIDSLPHMQLARAVDQSGLRDLMAAVAETHRSWTELMRSENWAELSSALSGARTMLNPPEDYIAAMKGFDAHLRSLALTSAHAVTPLANQLAELSKSVAVAIRPIRDDALARVRWEASLSSRLLGVPRPWAFEDHLNLSVTAFARIARLHDFAIGLKPFDPESRKLLDHELGDPVPFDPEAAPEMREVAQIEAGLNPEIIAFPADAYPAVLISAGFEFRIESIVPVVSNNGDSSGVYHSQHGALLGQVENRLRCSIEMKLREIAGDAWQKRIHGDMRRKWQERKDKDQKQRGDSYPLITYADFGDLMDIICQGENWNAVFEPMFYSKEDFRVSMQRLMPVRNALGHHRPLVRADQLVLACESFRILNALGVSIGVAGKEQ